MGAFFPYPLFFSPILKVKPWGGDHLQKYLSKGEGKEENIQKYGESWEISPIPDNESVVMNGIYQGETINTLVELFGDAILGKRVASVYGKFPLLIKFLSTASPLSIQVHPDDALAQKEGFPFGKSEFWYIVESSQESNILLGLQKELTPDFFEKSIVEDRIADLLNTYTPKKGEYYSVPAGQIHGIGKDILLLEIQQASDLTYRIYDYKRLFNGEKRKLHIENAKIAANLKAYHPQIGDKNKEKLHISDKFKIYRYDVRKKILRDTTSLDSFLIYICIEGKVSIEVPNKKHSLEKGQVVLLPAQTGPLRIVRETDTSIIIEVSV